MHAPLSLTAVSAAVGVAIPAVVYAFTVSLEWSPFIALARVVSLALVPAVVARIAYRQGFDRASSQAPSKGNECDRRPIPERGA
jgi:hypothetical protein